MAKWYEQRTNTGYEIQYYDHNGNCKCVCGCESLEELGLRLATTCNGTPSGNFPTVWLDGHRLIGKNDSAVKQTSAYCEIKRLKRIVEAFRLVNADYLDESDKHEIDAALTFLICLSRHSREIDRLIISD